MKIVHVGIIVVVVLLLFTAVSCQVQLWKECRSDHSWLYCARVLGHK